MADSDKPECKYGAKCYRKEKAHLENFSHSSADDGEDEKKKTEEPMDESDSKTPKPSINLKGRNIVFAGLLKHPKEKMMAEAKKHGCIVTTAISKEIDILIVGDAPGKKEVNAKALGIKIVTDDEWDKIIAGNKPVTPAKEEKSSEPEKKKATKRAATHQMSQSDDEMDAGGDADKAEAGPSPKKAKVDDSGSPAKASPAKASPTKGSPSKKAKCKYWDACYRKDKDHLKQFLHPSDPVEEESLEIPQKTRLQKRNSLVGKTKPDNEMKDNESIDLPSGVTIKRVGDHYSCTCMGWKIQNNPVNRRTCKHLKSHLGEDFEMVRCDDPTDKPKKAGHIPRHKQVSVLLANKWDEKVNPTGWWLSEKLDGVRAYWDGKCFYSRLGNAFVAPHWFIKDFPADMTLDGELFGGRKKFQSTVSIVKTDESPKWSQITYQVFDAPYLGDKPFEKRMEILKNYFGDCKPKYATLLKQEKCTGKQQVNDELKRIIGIGGEGVMLREPKSKYEKRRSPTLLKYKKFYDAEAIVIGHKKGQGKNQFVVGALQCRMACGIEFKVGSGLTDKDRRNPPKIGSIITYKFQEYSDSGTPRFPTFLGIRIDADKPKDAELPTIKNSDD